MDYYILADFRSAYFSKASKKVKNERINEISFRHGHYSISYIMENKSD